MEKEILGSDVERSDHHSIHENPKASDHKDEGFTLDKALVSIRGNYRFYIVISSVFVSFAFGEAVLFNLPFLQLVPPLECYREVNSTGAFKW